jgi:hypothetical protein
MDESIKKVLTTNSDSRTDAGFILKLLLEYNEQTRKIVEDLIDEIREVRGGGEHYAVLDNRLSAVEIRLKDASNECKVCITTMRTWIDDLKMCQVTSLEKFHEFEKQAIKEHMQIREDVFKILNHNLEELEKKYEIIKEKLGNFDKEASGKYSDLDKKLSVNIAKVSAIIVIIFWALKFLAEKFFSHIIK